jgi:hypothetical protein
MICRKIKTPVSAILKIDGECYLGRDVTNVKLGPGSKEQISVNISL